MLRFLALDFLAKMWLPKARSRVSLPEPVILTRLAVALWVFNFGIKLFPFFRLLILWLAIELVIGTIRGPWK